MSQLQQPLENSIFRRLFSAQVIALIGAGLTTVALTLLAYQMSPDNAGTLLGAVLAIKMIAYVFFAPIVGGIAHRFHRKGLMILLDVLRAGVVVTLSFVTAVWQVYLLIFLLSLFSAGFKPVFQSTIPDILENEEAYTKALSYSRLAYDLETLLSPMLAGLLLLVITFDALFMLNGVAFVISATLIISTTLPVRRRFDRLGGLTQQVTFGIRSYFKTPRLRAMLALYPGVAVASAMVIVNTVVYIRQVMGGSEAEVALALAASGAGSMAAAFWVPRLLRDREDRPVMLAGTLVMSLALFGMITTPSLPGLLLLWLVVGFGWSLVQTPAGRVVARSSAPADRDAYYSAQFALTHTCWLIAYPTVGYLGEAVGIVTASVYLSIVVAAAAVAGYLLWPNPDPLELTHTHEAVAHTHRHFHDDHHEHGHDDEEHHHSHGTVTHSHPFVIDDHHPSWPR